MRIRVTSVSLFANILVAAVFAMMLGATLGGCASPGNHVEKRPVIGLAQVFDENGQPLHDANGEPVMQEVALADHVTFDLDGFAGEGVIYDNFQKNFITLSTKDEGIEDFTFDAKFDEETGAITSINATIGRKDANASDPTIAAWNGYGQALRTVVGEEGLGELLGNLISASLSGP